MFFKVQINIEKEEWVLKDDTVYASYKTIMDSLQYDFFQEENFSYNDLSLEELIKHLSRFTSNIWQVHLFVMVILNNCSIYY